MYSKLFANKQIDIILPGEALYSLWQPPAKYILFPYAPFFLEAICCTEYGKIAKMYLLSFLRTGYLNLFALLQYRPFFTGLPSWVIHWMKAELPMSHILIGSSQDLHFLLFPSCQFGNPYFYNNF